MKKNIVKNILVPSMIFFLVFNLLNICFINGNKAYAATSHTMTISGTSYSSSASRTVNIPNLVGVQNVTVDNGTRTYTVSGENVTVNISNLSNTQWYICDSKIATDSRIGSTGIIFPDSVPSNIVGYTGNLPKSGSAYVISGLPPDSKTATAYLTGDSTVIFPEKYHYDVDGYTGDLPMSGSAFVISGTPADSKTATATETFGARDYWRWSGLDWVYDHQETDPYSNPYHHYDDGVYRGDIPMYNVQITGTVTNYPYPSDPYVGQMFLHSVYTDTAYYSGTVYKPDTRVWQQNYSGTVTRPDTRTWQQNYSGTVYLYDYYYVYTLTITYTTSSSPEINVTSPIDNSYASSAINAAGTLKDIDIGETETVKYTIGSKTGTIAAITSDGTWQNFSGNIDVSDLASGTYSLQIWCVDNYGKSSAVTTRSIIIDKTLPVIGQVSVSSTDTSITITGTATDNVPGLDAKPYRYIINDEASDWLAESTFTKTSLNPASSYSVTFQARDMAGNIQSSTQDILTKIQSPVITANSTTPVTIEITMGDNSPDNTQYQIKVGNEYVSSDGTLSSVPAWITVQSKKITVTGLSPSTSYIVQAKAKDINEYETPMSQPVSVTTLQHDIIAPSNIQAAPGISGISLVWDAVSGASGYDVEADGVILNTDGTHIEFTGLTPNTRYTYRVRAKDLIGPGSWSQLVTASTVFNPPVNITAVPGNSKISLSWDPVDGALGYDVEADGVIKHTAFEYIDFSGLTPNTQHTFRVRSTEVYGTSGWSPIVTVSTTSDPLGDMTNVNVYIENTSVTLTWGDVLNAESYDVEFDGKVFSCGIDTFCIQAGLLPKTQHIFRVRALNIAGEGAWSDPYTITTCLLDTPKNIKFEKVTDSISLAWDPVEDASEYIIQDNGQTIATVAESTYKNTGLSPETQHIYTIKAVNAQGESAESSEISIFTLPVKPPVPLNIVATIVNNMITLDWDPVIGAIGYDVELDGIFIDNGDSTVYTHEELEKNTRHTYRVRAKNEAAEGDWSDPIELKTMEGNPVPPSIIIVSTTPTITTLDWEEQPDAISYDIEADGIVVDNISNSYYRHRRLTPLTEHYYRIRTRNITGVSPWSGYIINNSINAICRKGKEVDLGLTASDILDFSKYTLNVNYNPDVLEVADLCTLSSEIELAEGEVEGTGIIITSFKPGSITFTVDKSILPGESWSGIINSIRFKAKASGGTSITYAVFSKSEDEQ